MKKLSLLLVLLTIIFYGCSTEDENNTVTACFEGKLTEAESQYIGYDKLPDTSDWSTYSAPYIDNKNLVELSYYYGYWGFAGGFTYTNKTDKTTPGYGNISAIAGKAKVNTTYLTAYASSFDPAQITNLNPAGYEFKGMWVTNSTYAYLVVKDGNSGTSIPADKFEAGDWFKLTAVGYNASNTEIGRTDFYLADFRNSKSAVVNEWKWFDLTSISSAKYIKFEMSSTDNDPDPQIGMKTPAYFCADGITLIEK